MIAPSFCVMDGEVIEADFEAGLAQENWSLMPSLEELPPNAAGLDREQREFARTLAAACEDADWGDGRELHTRFKRSVADVGIEERKASNAVYDLILESPFCVPVGWLLDGLERAAVLHRLQGQ